MAKWFTGLSGFICSRGACSEFLLWNPCVRDWKKKKRKETNKQKTATSPKELLSFWANLFRKRIQRVWKRNRKFSARKNKVQFTSNWFVSDGAFLLLFFVQTGKNETVVNRTRGRLIDARMKHTHVARPPRMFLRVSLCKVSLILFPTLAEIYNTGYIKVRVLSLKKSVWKAARSKKKSGEKDCWKVVKIFVS